MRGCAVLMGWIRRSRVTRTGLKFLGVLRLCPGLGCVRGGRTKVRRGESRRVLPPLPQRCGLERFAEVAGASLPRRAISSHSPFLLPILFPPFPPHTPFCISSCLFCSFFFQLHSSSSSSPFLSRPVCLDLPFLSWLVLMDLFIFPGTARDGV